MTVLVADDHPLMLQGTQSFVKSLGYDIPYVCTNGLDAFERIVSHEPLMAVLDVNMPKMDGLEVLEKIYQCGIPTHVIFFTMHKEVTLYKKARSLGLAGYLLKEEPEEELKTCLKVVSEGGKYMSKLMLKEINQKQTIGIEDLTFAEKKVLELIAQQKTSKQIGNLLFISEKTVEKHRSNIIQKLNLPKEKNILLHWAIKHFLDKQI
jgi:DNA-binding NarL/FixJ family response regulator